VGELVTLIQGSSISLKNSHVAASNNGNNIQTNLPKGIKITKRIKNGDIQIIKGSSSNLEKIATFIDYLNQQAKSQLHSLIIQENEHIFEIHINSNKQLILTNIQS
jgi:hypothetical protein